MYYNVLRASIGSDSRSLIHKMYLAEPIKLARTVCRPIMLNFDREIGDV